MLKKYAVAVLVMALPPLIQAATGCGVQFTSGEMEPEDESFKNSYVCACDCAPPGRAEDAWVVASEDDAVEGSDGTVLVQGDELHLHTDMGDWAGIRFDSVMIPGDAIIDSAFVEFIASRSESDFVEIAIFGEASLDAAAFAGSANEISSRPVVASSVMGWTPTPWVADDPHVTPDITGVVQDIVGQVGWVEGSAMALLFQTTSGAGQRHAHSYDGRPMSTVLRVTYHRTATPDVSQDFRVCALADDNANLKMGGSLDPGEAAADCEGRVETTLSGLADACGYPSQCSCSVVADSAEFASTCDSPPETPCTEVPLAFECANFDPVAAFTEATNAPGDEPVCLSSSPLSFGVYGRRSRCSVDGQAIVQIEDAQAVPGAGGTVQFRGDPCVGGGCPVAMEYDIAIGNVTFSSFFDSATFSDLAGVGGSGANEEVLAGNGDVTYGSGSVGSSARGLRDGSEQGALTALNDGPIAVNVSYGSVDPTCSVEGDLAGSVDPELMRCDGGPNPDMVCEEDSECEPNGSCEVVSDSDLALSLAVAGDIINQPPTADAGPDQVVECPAMPVLDASGSSDLDSNIMLYSWRLGSRTGEEVGFRQMSTVAQDLGIESYVLRVIDNLSQTDEDTTVVEVEDTTPPELSCAVEVSLIDQFNHVLHDVGLTGRARDACEGVLPVTVSVFGDEDDEMPTGDGSFSPDAASMDLETLRLRGERRGDADGRVYLVLVEATDSSGNRGVDCCTVAVPHSKSKKARASVEAQAAAAQAFCLANEGAPPAGYFVVGDGAVIGPKQ